MIDWVLLGLAYLYDRHNDSQVDRITALKEEVTRLRRGDGTPAPTCTCGWTKGRLHTDACALRAGLPPRGR
jgi:hypothetical protein